MFDSVRRTEDPKVRSEVCYPLHHQASRVIKVRVIWVLRVRKKDNKSIRCKKKVISVRY